MLTTESALFRLMTWLSPSYPVGAFSYSHSLEWLVEEGTVTNASQLLRWIEDVLRIGSGRNDAIIFAAAHKASQACDELALLDICALASASAPSSERWLETTAQGQAFSNTTRTAWNSATLDRLAFLQESPVAYPVAVAVAAADHGISVQLSLAAYMHAFGANLVSAGVRLIPLGHTDGQITTAGMESAVQDAVVAGLNETLEDLGGATVFNDIASMKHETQYTRLFRS